jgi:prolipoprotein diacylglyceryltransferase
VHTAVLLWTIDEQRFVWVYPALVMAGLLLLVLVPTSQAIPPAARRKYAILQGLTLAGALVGAKVAMLMGDRGWPWTPLAGGWHEVLFSGRSITGGLLGGFGLAEIGKPILRYDVPPNDLFAVKLPFSVALGRIGCIFGGCCRGVPWDGPFAVQYSDGVPRVPATLVEFAFQLAMGLAFVAVVRRRRLPGGVFAFYLVAYGVFRFATEPLRETPKPWNGFSAYQAFALAMIAAGLASLYARVLRRERLPEAVQAR